jgi:Ca2+-binding RTX toxin-like protein
VRRMTLLVLVVTALVALVVASGVALAATINGDNRDNKLTGTSQADVIRGYGGDDRIIGGNGMDRIYAGAGNDFVSSVGDDSNEDVVRCGRGIDTVNRMPGPGAADTFVGCEKAVY